MQIHSFTISQVSNYVFDVAPVIEFRFQLFQLLPQDTALVSVRLLPIAEVQDDFSQIFSRLFGEAR
jgi:hypothetical protein